MEREHLEQLQERIRLRRISNLKAWQAAYDMLSEDQRLRRRHVDYSPTMATYRRKVGHGPGCGSRGAAGPLCQTGAA